MTLLNQSVTSDKDYLEIFQDGQVLVTANAGFDTDSSSNSDPFPAFGFQGNTTVNHNLNYIPIVRAFIDPNKNGMWYSAGRPDFNQDPWLKFIVTTTTAKFYVLTDGGAKTDIPIFYRVYKLGDKSITSDDRIDKIFLKDQSSGVVAASPDSLTIRETILPIPHSGGEAPIFTVQFSESPAGPWYGEQQDIIGPYDTSSGPPGGPYARFYFTSMYARCDVNNLYVHLQSNYPSQKTIYVRYTVDYRD